MGHYVAARQRGLDVGAPAFIPFVGAWIALKDQPVDVETEAYVAIAGPVVGTIAALAVYLWARSEDSGMRRSICCHPQARHQSRTSANTSRHAENRGTPISASMAGICSTRVGSGLAV